MRQNEINEELGKLVFCFFYKFSRFEFALKENGYLRDSRPGCRAAPDWCEFARERGDEYRVSPEAEILIATAPKSQVVAAGGGLEWKHVDLKVCPGRLGKVVLLVQTVRNNLFHGGKHGAEGWDDLERTARLLTLGVAVLDQIAEQTGLDADYSGYY